VTPTEVLRVPVALLDPVEGVLAEGRVHALGRDHELWAPRPLRDGHVNLLLVCLAEDVGVGASDAVAHLAGVDALEQLGLELLRHGLGVTQHGDLTR
jgi:hypothetical protein